MNIKCFLVEVTDEMHPTETGFAPFCRVIETGEKLLYKDLPVGAMMYVDYLSPTDIGDDGKSLAVKTPGGLWYVDTRASNCDSPCKHCNVPYVQHTKEGLNCGKYEDANPHKCWVRHGEPPNFTVDKNGVTCGAGAGSIQIGEYHGFLRNGELTDC